MLWGEVAGRGRESQNQSRSGRSSTPKPRPVTRPNPPRMLTEITQHASVPSPVAACSTASDRPLVSGAFLALSRFVSPEEHATLTSSTPESFASIPPIVRYQQQEVRIAFSPDWQSYGEQGQVGSLLVTEA